MSAANSSRPPFGPGNQSPFGEARYHLPDLLAEVKLDRASTSFAMEKLDQPAITKLFEHHRSRRAAKPRK